MTIICSARIAWIRSIDEIVERREDLCGLTGGRIEKATPDFGGGKAREVKRVTMPKLLEPPLRACHKSGSSDAEAVVMAPEASTTS